MSLLLLRPDSLPRPTSRTGNLLKTNLLQLRPNPLPRPNPPFSLSRLLRQSSIVRAHPPLSVVLHHRSNLLAHSLLDFVIARTTLLPEDSSAHSAQCTRTTPRIPATAVILSGLLLVKPCLEALSSAVGMLSNDGGLCHLARLPRPDLQVAEFYRWGGLPRVEGRLYFDGTMTGTRQHTSHIQSGSCAFSIWQVRFAMKHFHGL